MAAADQARAAAAGELGAEPSKVEALAPESCAPTQAGLLVDETAARPTRPVRAGPVATTRAGARVPAAEASGGRRARRQGHVVDAVVVPSDDRVIVVVKLKPSGRIAS